MTFRRFNALLGLITLAILTVAPAGAAVPNNEIENYLERLGVAYSKSPDLDNAYVVHYTTQNTNAEKVTVFVINDEERQILECYAYADLKLQNIRNARHREAVMARLLELNYKAFGTFFVDHEGDVGVRFTFTTENGVGFESFKVAVETLRRVADNAAPTINRLLAHQLDSY